MSNLIVWAVQLTRTCVTHAQQYASVLLSFSSLKQTNKQTLDRHFFYYYWWRVMSECVKEKAKAHCLLGFAVLLEGDLFGHCILWWWWWFVVIYRSSFPHFKVQCVKIICTSLLYGTYAWQPSLIKWQRKMEAKLEQHLCFLCVFIVNHSQGRETEWRFCTASTHFY